MQYLQKKNLIILSQNMDLQNPVSGHVFRDTMSNSLAAGQTVEQAEIAATKALHGITNMQAMLLSWKEIFGGITC